MGWGDQPKWDKRHMLVPFDKQGNLDKSGWGNPEWRRVYSFRSMMKICDYSNTTGSATFTLMDNQGIKYPIYVKDFLDVVSTRKIEGGYIEESTWTFKKTGRHYAILLEK